MSGIASKNLYDLLGNDPDQDPDRAPSPPTKAVDKPAPRTGKRNVGPESQGANATGTARGGRVDGAAGNIRSEQPREDGRQDRPNRNRDLREDGGRGRGRGGRGGRGGERGGRGARDDRHSKTGIQDHEKQVAAGWGGETGESEWADEKAGANIANAEVKNDAGFTPDTNAADPAFATGPDGIVGEADVAAAASQEPEDNTKSYAEYLEEMKSKRAGLSSTLEIRKANEGTKQKFPEGKPVQNEEEEYFAGAMGKTTRQKENKSKNVLTMDGNYYAAPSESRDGGRGGRGGARGRGEGGRGGRGRADGDRSGRGRGDGFRGDRGGRGRADGPRGGRGGPRGDFSNGNSRAPINVTDESAFPSLG